MNKNATAARDTTMTRFGDLHLCPSMGDLSQVERMVSGSSELGYHFVGVSLPLDAPRQWVRHLQRTCNNIGVDLVTRVDLAPRTPRELLEGLRRFRRRFEVVSVVCVSKPVARQAAKDRRVDLLSFLTDPRKRFFDLAEAELASNALASLEIDMAPLLLLRGFSRIRLLSRLRREVKIAERIKVPIVASSGATNEHLLRGPRDYAALATLFDLTMPLGLQALSENPWTIVERNREKLSPSYVAPGVRVMERNRKCPGA